MNSRKWLSINVRARALIGSCRFSLMFYREGKLGGIIPKKFRRAIRNLNSGNQSELGGTPRKQHCGTEVDARRLAQTS